jgi:branched-chain amino acid transport system ATP-binding protein
MLTIARALMGNPELLLDEPSEGLAPLLVQTIAEQIRKLKANGLPILLWGQNTQFSFPPERAGLHHRKGGIQYQGQVEELDHSPEIKLRYLGIA